MSFLTNFKHQSETAAEHRARAKSERLAEQRACYLKVDRRDGGCDRVDGQFLWPGHTDPRLRREHHHMEKRSRGGQHDTANVITTSAYRHQQIHAGKERLSGNADLRDADGKLCGVTHETLTDGGFEIQAMV